MHIILECFAATQVQTRYWSGFQYNLFTFFFRYSKGVASPERFVRTRLYFTSESHIHSLLNMLRFGGLCNVSHVSRQKYILCTVKLAFTITLNSQFKILQTGIVFHFFILTSMKIKLTSWQIIFHSLKRHIVHSPMFLKRHKIISIFCHVRIWRKECKMGY